MRLKARFNQPHTFWSARFEITGRERQGQGGAGHRLRVKQSSVSFHKTHVGILAVYISVLFVLGSETVQVPYQYNFCRAVSVYPSSSL